MPCVHPQLTELGQLLVGLSEVEVVGLPTHAADQAVTLRRREGDEDVVVAMYLTPGQQCLDIAAPAMRADRAFGDHADPPVVL